MIGLILTLHGRPTRRFSTLMFLSLSASFVPNFFFFFSSVNALFHFFTSLLFEAFLSMLFNGFFSSFKGFSLRTVELEDDDEDVPLVVVLVLAVETEIEGSDRAVEDEDEDEDDDDDEVMESGLRSEQLAALLVLESLSDEFFVSTTAMTTPFPTPSATPAAIAAVAATCIKSRHFSVMAMQLLHTMVCMMPLNFSDS
jgi:hypothetical protein